MKNLVINFGKFHIWGRTGVKTLRIPYLKLLTTKFCTSKVVPLDDLKNSLNVYSGEGYYQNRIRTLREEEKLGRELYPYKFCTSHSVKEFKPKYEHLSKGDSHEDNVSIAGRVIVIRASSKKLKFFDLIDEGEKLQVIANFLNYGDCDLFHQHCERVCRGDIVGVEGIPTRSNSGELSILASNIQILTPCLRMLPNTFNKVKNKELIYRQRYLDLFFNEHSREKFIIRSKTISFIRKYLEDLNFIEVETPILGPGVGGANAEPFKTRHLALGLDLYLRIAPELYLKTLVVGGFNRVFEIGKQFRNEGEDPSHNPEFTSVEFYMAYGDINNLIEISEDLIAKLVWNLFSSFTVRNHLNDEILEINFSPPFRKIKFLESLENSLKVTLPPPDQLHTENAHDYLLEICLKNDMDVSRSTTTVKLLDKLFAHFVEPECVNPTFVLEYPKIMSPLAKSHRSIPALSERFELFVAKTEICNAYTELNDPLEQRERFSQQISEYATEENVTETPDENFCKALEYGLPPTAGWGMGIDRLLMVLTNSNHIKDVILFPILRPKNK